MVEDKPTLMTLEELGDDVLIRLNDGSKWELAPGNVPTASTWLPSSRVTVRFVDEESKYQYEITHIAHGDSIKVRKVT